MILFECNPDQVLIKKLLPHLTKKEFEHKKGKGNILKALLEKEGLIGLVDRDNEAHRSPLYNKFRIEKRNTECNFIIYRANNDNLLIELDPRLEGWIMRVARLNKVDVRDFGFSTNEKDFHKKVNIKLEKFEYLIEALLSSNCLQELKEALTTKY